MIMVLLIIPVHGERFQLTKKASFVQIPSRSDIITIGEYHQNVGQVSKICYNIDDPVVRVFLLPVLEELVDFLKEQGFKAEVL